MEILLKYWAPIWSILVSLGLLTMAFLSKTYAKHEHVAKLASEVEKVKVQIAAMPSATELHELNIEMCNLRGELKTLKTSVV